MAFWFLINDVRIYDNLNFRRVYPKMSQNYLGYIVLDEDFPQRNGI
jgi:hypothetical protein